MDAINRTVSESSTLPPSNSTPASRGTKPYIFTHLDIFLLCSLSVIFVVSLISNSVLAWTIWKKHGFRGSAGIKLLFHLCVVNLLQTVLVMPFHIINKASSHRLGDWFTDKDHGKFCIITAFGSEFFIRASWVFIALIAFDRHQAIVHTLNYRKRMSSTFVGFLLGFGWLGVFLGLLMDSILWRTNEFKRSTYLCLVDRRGLAPYLAVEFAHSLLVPLCVILYCYGRIFVLALSKKLKVYIGAIAPQEIAQPPGVEGESGGTNNDSAVTGVKRISSRDSIGSYGSSAVDNPRKPSATKYTYNTSYRAVRTVLIVVGSFLLTSGVFVVATFMESFASLESLDSSWLKAVGFCAALGNTAVCPFVYGLLNRLIRHDLYSVFRARFRLDSVRKASIPGRRWSISSHVLDYFPTFAGTSRTGSRRTSADSIDMPGYGGGCRDGCGDAASNSSSVFHNFFASKSARRRVSAPSRLQHSTTDPTAVSSVEAGKAVE